MTQEEKQTKSSDHKAPNPLEKVLEEALLTASKQKAKAKDWEPQFSRYVELKQERLLRLAYHITGCWHAASDVVQDSFIALHKQLFRKGFEGGSIGGWLTVVASNNALGYLRKEKIRGAAPISNIDDPAAPSQQNLPEREEELAEAWRRIEQLPEQQRRVFTMKEVEGCDFDEIAKCLGIQPKSARSYHDRALGELRKMRER